VEGAAACAIASNTPFEPLLIKDIAGRKAKQVDAPLRQPRVALRVMNRLFGIVMRRSIDLHRQAGRRTKEIDDVRSDRMLAPET